MRPIFLFLLVISTNIGLGSGAALASEHPGKFQNCSPDRLRVYVNGRMLMILEPQKIYDATLPQGRQRVKVQQMYHPKRVVLQGKFHVKGAGWFIEVGCGKKGTPGKMFLFAGHFRNSGKQTLLIYLNEKLWNTLEPGKRLDGKFGGSHQVRIVSQKDQKTLLQRSFFFGRNWRIEWGCSSSTKGKFRCAKGYYPSRVNGKIVGC